VSQEYPDSRTLDHRYAGCSTVDTRNLERINRQGQWEDSQTYIYDTAKTNLDWYNRDTIGIYLTPDTEDQQLIRRFEKVIKGMLPRFLPLSIRAVVVINPPGNNELVYTYDFPTVVPQRRIEESYHDMLDSIYHETINSITDLYQDLMPNWRWFHTWSEQTPDSLTVNTDEPILDLNFRIFYKGIQIGEN